MTSGKTWSERWSRLASMGRAELLGRLRQQARARIDALRYVARLGFGVRSKSSSEIRPSRFFFAPEDVSSLCATLKDRLPQPAELIVRRAEKICRHRFDMLGYDDLDYGDPIDWHCDPVHHKRAPRTLWYAIRYLDFSVAGDVKIIWELNRHQHLVTLAKAFRLTGDERFSTELFNQWRQWQLENPYPLGVNWASSLEVAMRALSWIWVYFLLGDSALPGGFRGDWLNALGLSARHIERNLSTYFSPNTHLLGEAVGLFFIGTLCPELEPAERWKRLGWSLILREARRQVRSDGFHFEQSLYYHVYALDCFLHAAVLAAANEMTIPPEFERTAEKMLSTLCLLGRAGAPPRFGDDDGGRVFDPTRNRSEHMLDPLATGAVLYGRGDFKSVAGSLREETVWLLGAQGIAEFDRIAPQPAAATSTALEASGLYLMTDPPSQQQIVIDAGPQGAVTAGHGHADALSLCWSYQGHPLLIDPGTCEYVGNGSNRPQFRGTAAHNTLAVDGANQADPKGPFAWATLPKVRAEGWVNGQTFDLFVGSHDGYRRLANPVVHRRWVFSLKGRFLLVRDLALGEGKHRLDLFWHISSELTPGDKQPAEFEDTRGRSRLRLIEVEGNNWQRNLHCGEWSPVYGRKQPAPVLRFTTETSLPAEFISLLETMEASRPAGRLTRIAESSGRVGGFRYRTAEEDHSIFFAKPGAPWSLGSWSSDAEFLYWGGTSKGRVLICCNATRIDWGGLNILVSAKPLLRCEVVTSDEHVHVISSEPKPQVNRKAICAVAGDLGLAIIGKPASLNRKGS